MADDIAARQKWVADYMKIIEAERESRPAEAMLADEITRLRHDVDRLQLELIEARNPGIDMDEVRRIRAGGS